MKNLSLSFGVGLHTTRLHVVNVWKSLRNQQLVSMQSFIVHSKRVPARCQNFNSDFPPQHIPRCNQNYNMITSSSVSSSEVSTENHRGSLYGASHNWDVPATMMPILRSAGNVTILYSEVPCATR